MIRQFLQSFLFLFIDIAAITLSKTRAKPNTKIQRSPLFVATNVRKPPLLPCPVRATRFLTNPPPRSASYSPSIISRTAKHRPRLFSPCFRAQRSNQRVLIDPHQFNIALSAICYTCALSTLDQCIASIPDAAK